MLPKVMSFHFCFRTAGPGCSLDSPVCDPQDSVMHPWYRMEYQYQGNSTDTRDDWVFAFVSNIKDTFEGQVYEMNLWGTNEYGRASEPLVFKAYLPPPTKVNNFQTIQMNLDFEQLLERVDSSWFVDIFPPQRFESVWEREDVRVK